MKYNLKYKEEKDNAIKYLNYLIDKEAIVEIKQKHPERSLSQNNYLYLLLGIIVNHVGETNDYMKMYWKKEIAREIFLTQHIRKDGSVRDDYRSTADLSTKEMTDAIELLRNWSMMNLDLYLPEANERI